MFCTVIYDGSKQPDAHLAKGYVMKGQTLKTGERTRVDARLAGALQKHCPEGTITIVEGAPIAWTPPVPASAKAISRAMAEHREVFPVDPARALDGVGSLSKEVAELLRGPEPKAILHVRTGKADEVLHLVAVVAKLLGLDKLVEAALERHERKSKPADPAPAAGETSKD